MVAIGQVIVDLESVDPRPLPAVMEQRALAFTRSEDALLFRKRRTAIFDIARSLSIGEVQWRCPRCGAQDHGVPEAAGVSLSTSSSGTCLVVVFDFERRRIGVDITSAQAPVEANGIAELMFTAAERSRMPVGGWTCGDHFARIWSAKEALGKACGTGIATDAIASPGNPLDSCCHAGDLSPLQALPEGLVGSLAVLPVDSTLPLRW